MKILVIDDEQSVITLITKGLAAESLIVESATDGEQGLLMAKSGGYELIVLDCSLPKLSGPNLLKELRRSGLSVPVIMLTVRAEISDKEEAYSLGADDYLTKPFLLEELVLKIKALLRRPVELKFPAERLADLFFETDAGRFRRGRKELYFTKREYCLLQYLWRRQGEVVSRGEILEHVWHYNADPYSNSIETHIASLRKKINAKGRRNLIHTFPGRGYKLALKKLS